jgi:hypothetical protein
MSCLGRLVPLLLVAPVGQAVDLDMQTRIRAEGFRRSQVMETAAYLTDVLGPRLTNSPQLKRANEWTRERLAAWGLENARLEAWGPFGVGWSLERVAVHMTSPTVQALHALPRAWSPGTNGALRGRAVFFKLEDAADFEAAKGKLRDRIVLISAPPRIRDETEAPLERHDAKALEKIRAYEIPGPEGEGAEWRNYVGLRERLRTFLKAEGALACVEVGRAQGALRVQGTGGWKKDAERGVPWLTLMPEQYNRLVRLVERKLEVELEIDLRVRFHEDDLMGYNTLADIPGGDRKDELVMAGAHLDSWHGATGATDNAAGSAVMLEAARILKAVGARPRRTIRFALWTGEEQTLGGSTEYVARHFAKRGDPLDPKEKDLPAELQTKRGEWQLKPGHASLSAYFNVDSGTGRIRGVYAQENAGAAALLRQWLEPLRDLGVEEVTLNPDDGTDTEPFDEAGLPAFPFVQDPIEYRSRTWHTVLDVYDRLKREDLMQAAVVVAAVVYEAAMAETPMPRKPGPKP